MKRLIVLIAATLLASSFVWAQIPPQPKPARLVNDLADMLSPQQEAQLEQLVVQLDRKSSTQIAVVTVDDLGGLSSAEFATELGHQWGIGQADKDNGIVLLVKAPKNNSKGAVYLSIGYGLEGVLPDVIAHQIVNNEIIPQLQAGNFFAGILSGVDVVSKIVANEYSAEQYAENNSKNSSSKIGLYIIFFIIFVLSFIKRSPRGVTMDRRGDSIGGGFIPPFIFFGGGGFGGGGGSGGGFGGGGFSGFGGGDFGGGGAGGEW